MTRSTSAAHLPAHPRRHTHTRATFYMYTEAELDHGWLEGCAGFGVLRMSTGSEKLAEVGLRHSLYSSPLRVYDPLEAKVFYVPVYEWTPIPLRRCAIALPTCRLRCSVRTEAAWKLPPPSCAGRRTGSAALVAITSSCPLAQTGQGRASVAG